MKDQRTEPTYPFAIAYGLDAVSEEINVTPKIGRRRAI